jgi:hypothetical protein
MTLRGKRGSGMWQLTVIETVREALERMFSDLDGWFDQPPHQLHFRPDYTGAWTVAEQLEHVSLVNHFLLLTITKGCARALKRAGSVPLPPQESDLVPLLTVADPDAFPWSPPSHMVPTGACETTELRALLHAQRRQSLELLAAMPAGEGRLCTVRMSVHDLGRLDMYQWLYFLAQHGRYHVALLGRYHVALLGRKGG